MENHFKPNFTQTPNYFYDVLLKELSSTEVHVLCAIIRKTYGWHKAEDRISFSQLKKETGLALSTVQSAIKKLVDKGIVISKIVDGISCYTFLVEREEIKEDREEDSNNSCIPPNGMDIVQSNSYIPPNGMGVYRETVGGGYRDSVTQKSAVKEILKEKLKPIASFLDKISFNFETKQFENTDELQEFVTREYLERIKHFGYDAQKIYDDACETIVRRRGTRHEVKKPGIWLCNLFKDASFGNVYKYGHTSEVEKRNFEVNYRFFCSLESYENIRVEGRFLIYKNREFSFYSSHEVFRAFYET